MSNACGRTREYVYQGDRLATVTSSPRPLVEEYRYDRDVLVAIDLVPNPVATIEVERDNDDRETGRSITPAPEIEIIYTRASRASDQVVREEWQSTLGTGVARYSFDGDRLMQVDESGFDQYTFWYAYDRKFPMGFAALEPTWTIHVDYDESDRELGRRWLTADVFWSDTNTYGVCEE